MPDFERLQQLERIVERLGRELDDVRRTMVRLRSELAESEHAIPSGTRPGPITPAGKPPAPPRARAALRSFGIEQFVGRYGALALAVVTIVMGAGALVSWALREGLLSPAVRVILGAVLAAGLAVAGLALRSRGNRPFGHTLLALALAVVHVVAWGAGPRLGLVPAWLSLAVAAAASLALSLLALRDESEQLFAVGVGGALLAPFVQRTGAEHFLMLAAYGVTVSTLALRTIGAREWRSVAAIVVLAAFVYASALGGYQGDAAWFARELAPGYAAVLAVAALVLTRPPMRWWIALSLTAMIVAVGVSRGLEGASPRALLRDAPDVLLMAVAGTALALWSAREAPKEAPARWIGGAVALPFAFLLKTIFLLTASRTDAGGKVHAAVALVWVLAFAVAAHGTRALRRGALLAASGIVATWAAVLALHDWSWAIPAACAGVAMLTAWISRREEQPLALVATVVAAVVGYAIGMTRLADLPGFGVPFTTVASAALAALMVGLVVAGRLAPATTVTVSKHQLEVPVVARVLVGIGCFFWWRAELQRAYNSDAATFLLIVYYAACGLVVLWRGRTTDSRRLRQVGLALSIWAALVALAEASAVQQIALRVGSYLGVGAFLLGVAWWYREAPGRNDGGAPETGARHPGA